MTSVNTNAAALTALRTLQNTNSQLETTQSRISTGYKIGEAKDNAAYWAISTTLKSDNKSLSTVKDALGLGASTVDTAYQGLNKAKDVLDEIKSKLTAATQDGVNRDTIQQEISQLQDQLKSIASSSVFSGENWLSVDTSAASYTANKQVVASFSRDATGAVSIGTIAVDTTNVALFDKSGAASAGGIIDKVASLKDAAGRDLAYGGKAVVTGNSNVGGLTTAANVTGTLGNAAANGGTAAAGTAATASTVTTTGGATKAAVTMGAASSTSFDVTKLKAGDVLSFTYRLGGGSGTVTTANLTYLGSGGSYTAGSGKFDTAAHLADELKNVLGSSAYNVTITSGQLKVERAATADETLEQTNFSITDASGAARLDRDFVVNAGSPTATEYVVAKASKVTTAAITLQAGSFLDTDKATFDFSVGGSSLKVTVGAAGGTDAARLSSLMANLNADTAFSQVATASIVSGALVIKAANATSIGITSVAFADKDGAGKVLSGTAFNNVAQKATATSSASFSGVITLDKDDSLTFDLTANDATSAKTVRVDQALVNKTLNVTTGQITTASDYQKVLAAALTAANVTDVTVAVNASDSTKLDFSTTAVGTDKKLVMTATTASKGGAQISLDKLDISTAGLTAVNATTSDQIKNVLRAYIDVVNSAINKVTSAAASLGSVASRIDMQKSFVNTLMDTIDKGVGNLIDADMTEESTKLQALQVKQQLGTQALSIANQSAQGVLSLFRS